MTHKVINENQTTFIPSKYILDIVLVSHEVLHELWCDKKKHGIPRKAWNKSTIVYWQSFENLEIGCHISGAIFDIDFCLDLCYSK